MTVTEQSQQIKDPNKSLEIRIFTLNIWGIPNVSKDRQERVQAIAQLLASAHEPYHYVFLQEVWSKSDFRFIADKLTKTLPYSHYFYSGVIGSGTCILSCSPIQEVHFHPFTLNGYPHRVHHGDWYGGKGLALCNTTFHGIPLILLNTHFHAEYDSEKDDYLHHRVAQAFEVSQVVRLCQLGQPHLALLAADLNCSSTDVPYRLLTSNTGFVDTFLDCPLKPLDGIGATNATPGNSYTPVQALKGNPTGTRIDYVFFRASGDLQAKTLLHDLPLPPRVPQAEFSYSDHEGVRAVLSVRRGSQPHNHNQQALPIFSLDPPPPPRAAEGVGAPPTAAAAVCFRRTDALLDASAVCTQGLRTVGKARRRWWWGAAGLCLLAAALLGVVAAVEMPPGGRALVSLALAAAAAGLSLCGWTAGVLCAAEEQAVLAAKLGLERLLDEVRQKNARIFEEDRRRKLESK